MKIRSEAFEDINTIYQLTSAAFAGKAYSDGTEPDIVNGLRNSAALKLSLVAEADGIIVGHVALSPVTIEGPSNWYGLGPISVAPAHQKQGIGTALMTAVLKELKDSGAHGCALVGDPNYYSRFGFVSSGAPTYSDTPVAYVQHLLLAGDAPQGEVVFHPAFGGA